MSAATQNPEDTITSFSALLAEGDLDALVDLYEPDATFVSQPGTVVSGRDAIRDALRSFLELQPRMTGEIEKILRTSDIALVANRWTLTGTGPDGDLVELSGVSADVLRRRADGRWGIAVDDPWGSGA